MSRRRAEFLRNGVASYLLAACIVFGCARPGGTLINAESGVGSAESGVASAAREMISYPDARDADTEDQRQTPKAERAVGYLAMFGGILVLILFAVAVYSVAKILGG